MNKKITQLQPDAIKADSVGRYIGGGTMLTASVEFLDLYIRDKNVYIVLRPSLGATSIEKDSDYSLTIIANIQFQIIHDSPLEITDFSDCLLLAVEFLEKTASILVLPDTSGVTVVKPTTEQQMELSQDWYMSYVQKVSEN